MPKDCGDMPERRRPFGRKSIFRDFPRFSAIFRDFPRFSAIFRDFPAFLRRFVIPPLRSGSHLGYLL